MSSGAGGGGGPRRASTPVHLAEWSKAVDSRSCGALPCAIEDFYSAVAGAGSNPAVDTSDADLAPGPACRSPGSIHTLPLLPARCSCHPHALLTRRLSPHPSCRRRGFLNSLSAASAHASAPCPTAELPYPAVTTPHKGFGRAAQ